MKSRTKPPLKSNSAASAAMDTYLHALLLLTDHGQHADTGELAARVGVSPAAASQMLKKLAEKGMVKVEPYRGAELTTEGLHRALRVVRRHRLLEVFLHEIVGFELQDLHARALALQPTIDDAFEDRIDAMLEHPQVDPHGKPIPSKNATWPKLGDAPLMDLPPGTAGRVSRILTENAEGIEYLHGLGVRPDALTVLEGIAPFDGPVSVRVNGQVVHLGRRLAQAIYVCDQEKAAVSSTGKSTSARARPYRGRSAAASVRESTCGKADSREAVGEADPSAHSEIGSRVVPIRGANGGTASSA